MPSDPRKTNRKLRDPSVLVGTVPGDAGDGAFFKKKEIAQMSKIDKLAEIEGMTVEELLEEATFDSVAKGICTNPDCDYTTTVEPDQSRGWCEICDTQTVASCLILMGMI